MEKYKFGKNEVRVCGKVSETEDGLEFMNSGTFIEFCGKSGRLDMEISGSYTEECYPAYLGVFLNGNGTPEKIWKIEKGLHNYHICWAEEQEETTVKIVKLTELQYGRIIISTIRLDGVVKPAKARERKLMFIGDSLTAGYGVSGDNTDLIFTTATENVTKAYPYLAAQALSADAWYVCWSGGGIISRWISPQEELPLTDILMPELFEKGKELDFVPDLIAINLGTNDASYTRGKNIRETAFIEKYIEFVHRIAREYPDAQILLQYGLMEKTLLNAVHTVADSCREKGIKCSFLSLPILNETDGIGTGGHPSFLTHKKTAEIVRDKIAEIMDWKE